MILLVVSCHIRRDDVQDFEDGSANITTFSFGDGRYPDPIMVQGAPVDPIPEDNNGSSANANLVVNGSFDSQDAWFGNAVNPVDGINQAFVEQAGNVWDVNLSQQVSLTPGADYTLSFQLVAPKVVQ